MNEIKRYTKPYNECKNGIIDSNDYSSSQLTDIISKLTSVEDWEEKAKISLNTLLRCLNADYIYFDNYGVVSRIKVLGVKLKTTKTHYTVIDDETHYIIREHYYEEYVFICENPKGRKSDLSTKMVDRDLFLSYEEAEKHLKEKEHKTND